MAKRPEAPEFVARFVEAFDAELGQCILVFGASNGALVQDLTRRGKQLTLVDIRQAALDRFHDSGAHLRLVVEGQEFDGFHGCFDSVLFYDTLHHVRDKQRKLDECRNVLVSAGKVVLYEPNIATKLTREYDQFGELKDSVYKLTLRRMLKRSGFRVRVMPAESLAPRSRRFKRLIAWIQETTYDPVFRILMLAQRVD